MRLYQKCKAVLINGELGQFVLEQMVRHQGPWARRRYQERAESVRPQGPHLRAVGLWWHLARSPEVAH